MSEEERQARLYLYRATVLAIATLIIVAFAVWITARAVADHQAVASGVIIAVVTLLIASFTLYRARLARNGYRRAASQQRSDRGPRSV